MPVADHFIRWFVYAAGNPRDEVSVVLMEQPSILRGLFVLGDPSEWPMVLPALTAPFPLAIPQTHPPLLITDLSLADV